MIGKIRTQVIRELRFSWDMADRWFGLNLTTNGRETGDSPNFRELFSLAIHLGKLWFFARGFVEDDHKERMPRRYAIIYEPGFGWTLEWREIDHSEFERVDEFLDRIGILPRKGD